MDSVGAIFGSGRVVVVVGNGGRSVVGWRGEGSQERGGSGSARIGSGRGLFGMRLVESWGRKRQTCGGGRLLGEVRARVGMWLVGWSAFGRAAGGVRFDNFLRLSASCATVDF